MFWAFLFGLLIFAWTAWNVEFVSRVAPAQVEKVAQWVPGWISNWVPDWVSSYPANTLALLIGGVVELFVHK